MFRANWVRLLIIACMTAITVSIVGGIGSLGPRLNQTNQLLLEMGYTDIWYHKFLAEGIERISYIFPSFFILVTALVVFMTITRLIETDRGQIGCFKTLGYSKFHIVFKYVLFIGVACMLGAVVGIMFGQFVIYPLLFSAIVDLLSLPEIDPTFPTFGIVVGLLTIVFSLLVTLVTVLLTVREKPSNLLRPKAPRHGGKILLERITPLWRILPFRYKSSLRNIFRYRVRFFMTVFSMTFSTALVFCGMSLSFALEYTNPYLMDTIRPISSTIVLAAVLLNAMVIYNITNINIEERKREIATLKVLGYKNMEVSGYVFREIFMLTVIGVIIGLPAGYKLMSWIFEYLRFGGIDFVDWYVWIITGVLAFTSLALANLLLFSKIHKVDMDGSLKVME